jgi:hypothetical protein
MKIKKIIFLGIFFSGILFLFVPFSISQNQELNNFVNPNFPKDVLIIFNSGGWGNTPLEKADDFFPIVYGIQETLKKDNLDSITISFYRIQNGFLGKVSGTKEMLRFFRNSSEIFSQEIEEFLKNNPQKRVILTGLSNGAFFINETMKKIDSRYQNRVLAIEAGLPFWAKRFSSDNVLILDNNGRDALSEGETKMLLISLLKIPQNWLDALITQKEIPFSRLIQVPGHYYYWDDVKDEISMFLNKKLFVY